MVFFSFVVLSYMWLQLRIRTGVAISKDLLGTKLSAEAGKIANSNSVEKYKLCSVLSLDLV